MSKESKKSVFETLNQIDVSRHTEKKGKYTYLSWAWAWAELKKLYPKSTYKIYKNDKNWLYHTDGRTANTEVGVTVEGLEHKVYLPIMNFKNQAMKLEDISMMDVNKAIQRGLAKAVAMHGLGLYIYAGQDLPESPKIELNDFQIKVRDWIGANRNKKKAVEMALFELDIVASRQKGLSICLLEVEHQADFEKSMVEKFMELNGEIDPAMIN